MPAAGTVWVNLELVGSTQAELDSAFEKAWAQVPAGAVVFHFPVANERDFLAEVTRYIEGLPPLLNRRIGIFLKEPLREAE